MDKRIVVFLVLSLAIILGFDLLLKQMGWLPEPPPVQDGSVPGPLLLGARANVRLSERQGQRADQSERPKPIEVKSLALLRRVVLCQFRNRR